MDDLNLNREPSDNDEIKKEEVFVPNDNEEQAQTFAAEELDHEEIPEGYENTANDYTEHSEPFGGVNINVSGKKTKSKNWVIILASLLTGLIIGGLIFGLGSPLIKDMFDGKREEFSFEKDDDEQEYNYEIPKVKDGEELSAVDIGKYVGPSVVGISAEFQYESFFGTSTSKGNGSGIIISEDGYIATNNHVINGASNVIITTSTGEKYEASLVGTDKKTDLAVIKINAQNLPAAKLGNSDELLPGETVIAIGNPLGEEFAGSLTRGIVSALNRTVNVDGVTYNMIQTDAAINPGNSGGALANMKGEVIGINSVKISNTDVEGLGFAIPVNDAKPVLEDIINFGKVQGRPKIGITVKYISKEEAEYYSLESEGLFVFGIEKGSGADKAGIERGDIILKCEGQDVKSSEALNEIRDKHKAGDKITLTINRDDEIMEIKVVLSEESSQ